MMVNPRDDSPTSLEPAKWIWVPDYDDAKVKGQFVLFRKTFHLEDVPTDKVLLHVSADTRYRLYLNGTSISIGPCKSYLSHWYFESVDISPFLKKGKNVLAARVLRFSYAHDGCSSLVRGPLPGLIINAEVTGQKLHTDESWRAKVDDSATLVPDSEWDYRLGPQFLSLNEKVDGPLMDINWNFLDFDDAAWAKAVLNAPVRKMSPILDPHRLFPRQIPVLPEIPSTFDTVVTCAGPIMKSAWQGLLNGSSSVTIPAHTTTEVDIEVLALTTGFIDLQCESPASTSEACLVEILYSECYETPAEKSKTRAKGNRRDFEDGQLYGMTDSYSPRVGKNHYSPFWFRTFRFIRLNITTKAQPLTLTTFTYRATHYPLDIKANVTSSSPLIQNLWDISINTLRNCMHETYEDCPFYEQNQFAMDTRSQILFTYAISRDDRLARKAIREFYASRREDGLVETHFPNPSRAMSIPTFSLFWVLMIYDHMVYFGDEELVQSYIGGVDGVLNYFHKRINSLGLVGQFDKDCWAFVDWIDTWFTPNRGFTGLAVPPSYYSKGAATFHSMIYAYALLKASELQRYLGRHDTANEYLNRHENLVAAVRKNCFDAASGFFLDGPGCTEDRSQHVQVFAVLAGFVSGSDAADLLRRSVLQRQEHGLTKASLAMSFYVFRAVSQAGVYEECWPTLIQPWKKMIADNMTTWAESEDMVRSDCHAWSAVPIWEICTEILGVESSCSSYWNRMQRSQTERQPRKELASHISAQLLVGDDETIQVEWGNIE